MANSERTLLWTLNELPIYTVGINNIFILISILTYNVYIYHPVHNATCLDG